MSSRQENHPDIGRVLNPRQTVAHSRHVNDMAEASERWLCARLGVSTRIVDAAGPDRGFDLVTRDGRTVDVKWTETVPGKHYGQHVGYPTLNLSTWKGKGYRAQLYAMICGETPDDFDRYDWCAGWATVDELLAAPLVNGRFGRPYHALGFDYLHPIDSLC